MSIESEDTIDKNKSATDESLEQEASEKPVAKAKYEVISIESIDTPTGMTGDSWFRYIVGEGGGKIEGLKEGTLKDVTLHAENFAEDLNVRSKGKVSNPVTRKKNVTPPNPPEKKPES